MTKLFKLGHRLANGAVVLRSHFNPTTGKSVVLAEWEENAYPYITWRTDLEGNCFLGHYFDEFTQASEDFDERIGS